MDEQRPLRLSEFAKRYKISIKTARRWLIKYKDLEAMRIGHAIYISPDALKEWEEKRSQDFQKVFRPKMI